MALDNGMTFGTNINIINAEVSEMFHRAQSSHVGVFYAKYL